MPQAIGARGNPIKATRNKMPSGPIGRGATSQGQAGVYAHDGVSVFGNISKADQKRLAQQYPGAVKGARGGNKS